MMKVGVGKNVADFAEAVVHFYGDDGGAHDVANSIL
jgi:hypothetical protein